MMPSSASPAVSNKRFRPKATRPIAIVTLTEAALRAMPESDYMNDAQIDFFRLRLLAMREEVQSRQSGARERLHEHEVFADPSDRASIEEENAIALRLHEREAILVRKIDEALGRIRNRDYGYCTQTGDPIGIARLLARPTASVCVQVKDFDERAEAHFRSR